jgi:hypothetical protein
VEAQALAKAEAGSSIEGAKMLAQRHYPAILREKYLLCTRDYYGARS